MSYKDLQKTRKNTETIKTMWVLFFRISPRLSTVSLMIYFLQNFMHMVYQRTQQLLCIHT